MIFRTPMVGRPAGRFRFDVWIVPYQSTYIRKYIDTKTCCVPLARSSRCEVRRTSARCRKKLPIPRIISFCILLQVVTTACPTYAAPRLSSAPLNSLTAVGTSSKLSAEMAHRACFCAFIIASSSATMLVCCCGGGGGAAATAARC
jgi:hypothetical protein